MSRQNKINNVFLSCFAEKRSALIPFCTAGDTSGGDYREFLHALPENGADIIEIGMPFSDPCADGPVIRDAGLRALQGGQKLAQTLDEVANLRAKYSHIPIVLMGYYNPIYIYGTQKFITNASQAGSDACIIVDLPPEESAEYGDNNLLPQIRLATPTADDKRLQYIANGAEGFVYIVSVAGVTGKKEADLVTAKNTVQRLKQYTKIPMVVGFGIRNETQVQASANFADGVVIGSALINERYVNGNNSALKMLANFRKAVGRAV